MTAKGASPSRRSQERLALESLLQVSRSLVESRDVAAIVRRSVDSLCGLLAAHHVALFRLDPESEDLIPVKVMYMSGTTEDAAMRQRLGEAGIELVQKPFSPDALVRRVRRALDSGPSRRRLALTPTG